jgi:hypothetical protein
MRNKALAAALFVSGIIVGVGSSKMIRAQIPDLKDGPTKPSRSKGPTFHVGVATGLPIALAHSPKRP